MPSLQLYNMYNTSLVVAHNVTITQGARPDFLTRRVVKGCAPEMIYTYIWYHNLGAQPCKSTTENWQEANNGGH